MKRHFLIPIILILGMVGIGHSDFKGKNWAQPVVIDTGDGSGGFNVTLGTTTALISQSGSDANVVWRIRTFQTTGNYTVWMGTYTPLSYGSGAGWYVGKSTASYTTRSQAAYYGLIDPAAGSATISIKGPYEYQIGEMPQ